MIMSHPQCAVYSPDRAVQIETEEVTSLRGEVSIT